MSSSKQQIIAALDAAEASYRDLASLPLEALTRPEKTELLKRLGEIDKDANTFVEFGETAEHDDFGMAVPANFERHWQGDFVTRFVAASFQHQVELLAVEDGEPRRQCLRKPGTRLTPCSCSSLPALSE